MTDAQETIGPRLVAVEHTASASARFTHVEWVLGNTCTYACSYCPAKLHDGSLPWLDYRDVLRFIDALDRHYRTLGRTVWLQYTGGEPTLYPKFIPLLSECRERGFKQSAISNGVRTRRFWREASPLLDYVILTFHIEFVDREHFFAVVEQVREHALIHVNVTMLPDRFEECYSAAMRLHETYDDITVTMKPLRVDFGDRLYDYTEDQMARLRRQVGPRKSVERATPRSTMTKVFEDGTRKSQGANQFIVDRENRWRGWRCAAGLESLRITAAGNVFRSVCRAEGALGNIGGRIELPSDYVRCDREWCSCVSDIQLTKYRN